MDTFGFYLAFGFEHILDWQGYDHMLFLLALCAIYSSSQWRQILILVTAFTIGHSLTLALAATEIIQIGSSTVEFLIALTIFLTALYNLFLAPGPPGEHEKPAPPRQSFLSHTSLHYGMALFFGFIHGMGFSNQFRSLLEPDDSLVAILLPFNLGIELGQILFVLVLVFNAYVLVEKLGLRFDSWRYGVSLVAANLAIIMMFQRLMA